jgi:hypothetical protein
VLVTKLVRKAAEALVSFLEAVVVERNEQVHAAKTCQE